MIITSDYVFANDLFVGLCDRNNTVVMDKLRNHASGHNRKIYFHTNYPKWRQVKAV